jgi:hypothetical protein
MCACACYVHSLRHERARVHHGVFTGAIDNLRRRKARIFSIDAYQVARGKNKFWRWLADSASIRCRCVRCMVKNDTQAL